MLLEQIVRYCLGLGEGLDGVSRNSGKDFMKLIDIGVVLWSEWCDVLYQMGLLNLAVSGDRVGDEGYTDACARVASEADET